MNSAQMRPVFAAFLDDLAEGHRDPAKWYDLIITHYFDDRLEEIRRDVARMFVNDNVDSERLKGWANELRTKST